MSIPLAEPRDSDRRGQLRCREGLVEAPPIRHEALEALSQGLIDPAMACRTVLGGRIQLAFRLKVSVGLPGVPELGCLSLAEVQPA